MAQTMNYLSENNLLEYSVLEEKAAAATAHHNELSAQIKAAETVSYTHLKVYNPPENQGFPGVSYTQTG